MTLFTICHYKIKKITCFRILEVPAAGFSRENIQHYKISYNLGKNTISGTGARTSVLNISTLELFKDSMVIMHIIE